PRREIVAEPSEAAVIEVDEPRFAALDQEVGEAHVRVNQPESLRVGAIPLQPRPQMPVESVEHGPHFTLHPGCRAPVTPDRVRVEDGARGPALPREPIRVLTAEDMRVALRRQRSELREDGSKIVLGGGLYPGLEGEQYHVAPIIGAGE